MNILTISVVFSILFLLPSTPATAYYEANPRDYLPALVKIEFGKWDIGFIAADGRQLVFNRKARRFAQVPAAKYTTLMTRITDVATVPKNLIAAINKAVTGVQPYSAPVRLTAKDPFTGTYWAATMTGLVQFTSDLKSSDFWYAADAFDGKTGAAIILMSTWAAPTDSLATFQIKLGISDTQAYYEAVRRIPPELRSCFDYQALSGLPADCPASPSDGNGRFLPQAFNTLLPFIIKSADFSPEQVWQATQRLCLFKDKATAATLAENADSGYFMTRTGAKQCLAWYRDTGIIQGNKFAPERLSESLERVRTALAAGEYYRALDIAGSLAEFGNPEGIELLNEFFINSPGGIDAPDYAFFGDAAQTLHYRDEFLPAVLAGIRKFYGMTVPQGCLYLDLTYEAPGKNRRGLEQLTALVVAVENATHPERIPHQPSHAAGAYSACKSAMASQLADKALRDEFIKTVYPKLLLAQRLILDNYIATPAAFK